MSEYYDRAGEPISKERWVELHGDLSYRHLEHTFTKKHLVSTVWMGENQQEEPEGEILIFESMIFGEGVAAGTVRRCTTEAEARRMHERMVELAKESDLTVSEYSHTEDIDPTVGLEEDVQ